jgi:hypothetical protein
LSVGRVNGHQSLYACILLLQECCNVRVTSSLGERCRVDTLQHADLCAPFASGRRTISALPSSAALREVAAALPGICRLSLELFHRGRPPVRARPQVCDSRSCGHRLRGSFLPSRGLHKEIWGSSKYQHYEARELHRSRGDRFRSPLHLSEVSNASSFRSNFGHYCVFRTYCMRRRAARRLPRRQFRHALRPRI